MTGTAPAAFPNGRRRVALLADIHGNRPAFRAVMDALDAESPNAILFAGDLIGGPHDEEIFAALSEHSARVPVYMVRGNGEDYIAALEDGTAPPEWQTARQFAMVRWLFDRLSPAFRDEIRALPLRISVELPGTDAISLFHGTPRDARAHLRPAINPPALMRAFAETGEPVLVCGHSHEQWLERAGGRMALSPGAISAPLDGSIGAEFALLDWDGTQWKPDFRCVPYNFDEFARDARESGMLATGYLARAHLSSIFHGGDWGRAFIEHARAIAARAGCSAPFFPDDIWEQAGQTFFAGMDGREK